MTVATRLPFVISLWKKSVRVRCLRDGVRVDVLPPRIYEHAKTQHNATSVNRFLSEYLLHPSMVPKSTKTSTVYTSGLVGIWYREYFSGIYRSLDQRL